MDFTSLLGHNVTYWKRTSKDGYGKPSFSAPVVLKGRWMDSKTLFKGSNGIKEIVFDSLVYLSSEVITGDYLSEGSITTSDPLSVSTAKEVKTVSKTHDFSGVDVLYTAYLKAN